LAAGLAAAAEAAAGLAGAAAGVFLGAGDIIIAFYANYNLQKSK
jgi:hypothetical protein